MLAGTTSMVKNMSQTRFPTVPAGWAPLRWNNISGATQKLKVNVSVSLQTEEGKANDNIFELNCAVNDVVASEGIIGGAVKTDANYPDVFAFSVLTQVAANGWFTIVGRTRLASMLVKCDWYNVVVTTILQ